MMRQNTSNHVLLCAVSAFSSSIVWNFGWVSIENTAIFCRGQGTPKITSDFRITNLPLQLPVITCYRQLPALLLRALASAAQGRSPEWLPYFFVRRKVKLFSISQYAENEFVTLPRENGATLATLSGIKPAGWDFCQIFFKTSFFFQLKKKKKNCFGLVSPPVCGKNNKWGVDFFSGTLALR